MALLLIDRLSTAFVHRITLRGGFIRVACYRSNLDTNNIGRVPSKFIKEHCAMKLKFYYHKITENIGANYRINYTKFRCRSEFRIGMTY